jgi:hypothetical protein
MNPVPVLRRQQLFRGRHGRRLQLLLWALAPVLLHATQVIAAPFAARSTEADPPTGDTSATTADLAAAEQTVARGNGIRWALGPVGWRGSLTLDLRRITSDDGRRNSGGLLIGDMEFVSYVWQPWFIQLRGGLGLVLDRNASSGPDAPSDTSSGRGVTGSGSVNVFPASRFPFQAHFDVGDSRAGGETLITHYRTVRLGLSQSWRPERGSDNWQFNFDHSRVRGSNGVGDTLTTLNGTGALQRGDHNFELGANWSSNTRLESTGQTRQALLIGRHAWQDNRGLTVDSMLTWNDLRLQLGNAGSSRSSDSRLVQLSTVGTWRPRSGQWFYAEGAPLVATFALRAVDTSQGSDGGGRSGGRNFSLSAGVAKEFSREWRGNAGLNLSRLEGAGTSATASVLTGSMVYSVVPTNFGRWRWTPSASINASLSDQSGGEQRSTAGVQGAHSVNRVWTPFQGHSVSLSIAQSLGVLYETPSQQVSRGLSHSAGVYWQASDNGGQTIASLTVSDSRTAAATDGKYQFANLQLSRRSQLSRYQSWSANLTAQISRSDAEQIDAFTGEKRSVSDGWQRYTSGSLSFESQRVFGVPRLRFTGLLSVNSQQFERRAAGDINAPLENVSESVEARLDWVVGRLDTRLSARMARVDGRTVSVLAARAVRRF